MESGELLTELLKVIGGGTGGLFVGYLAQKKAAKTEAVNEYKEFAEFTKKELTALREEHKECQSENSSMLDKINECKITINDLTIAMHNAIGTPKEIQKGLIK